MFFYEGIWNKKHNKLNISFPIFKMPLQKLFDVCLVKYFF